MAIRPRAWFTLPCPSLRAAQRHDVFLWIDDALDLPGQRVERAALLLMVGVPVIGTADARHHVAEGSFGMIAWHASPTHQRPRGAPQIVQGPAGHAASLIEPALELCK